MPGNTPFKRKKPFKKFKPSFPKPKGPSNSYAQEMAAIGKPEEKPEEKTEGKPEEKTEGGRIAKPTSPTQKPVTISQPNLRRPSPNYPQGEFVRVRIPKPAKRELLGIIADNYGNKLLVRCLDGHTRICRIPGKIRYKLRVRLGDVVLVQKWTVQENEKGDYLYRYTRTQVKQLLKKGFLKQDDLV